VTVTVRTRLSFLRLRKFRQLEPGGGESWQTYPAADPTARVTTATAARRSLLAEGAHDGGFPRRVPGRHQLVTADGGSTQQACKNVDAATLIDRGRRP
jgi:hypothetical protein